MASRGNSGDGRLGSFAPPGSVAGGNSAVVERLFAVPDNDATMGMAARMAAARDIASRLSGNADFHALAAESGRTPVDMAQTILRSWYANRGAGAVGAAQLAARDEFHLRGAAREMSSVPEVAQQLYAAHPEAFRGFVRAQYDATQALFQRAGITHLTLYRGLGLNAQQHIPAGVTFDDAAHQMDVTMRPLTSFTVSRTLAYRYARGQSGPSMLMAADVPVSRILSMPLTGFGFQDQSEVVVLGGTQSVTYRATQGS
jgi:hypothetical protein